MPEQPRMYLRMMHPIEIFVALLFSHDPNLEGPQSKGEKMATTRGKAPRPQSKKRRVGTNQRTGRDRLRAYHNLLATRSYAGK